MENDKKPWGFSFAPSAPTKTHTRCSYATGSLYGRTRYFPIFLRSIVRSESRSYSVLCTTLVASSCTFKNRYSERMGGRMCGRFSLLFESGVLRRSRGQQCPYFFWHYKRQGNTRKNNLRTHKSSFYPFPVYLPRAFRLILLSPWPATAASTPMELRELSEVSISNCKSVASFYIMHVSKRKTVVCGAAGSFPPFFLRATKQKG